MDPLAPEFTRNLVRKTARIMADMDRVMRPGGIATDEGLSSAVHAGMQHLAAHNGDVHAAITSAKAAGARWTDSVTEVAAPATKVVAKLAVHHKPAAAPDQPHPQVENSGEPRAVWHGFVPPPAQPTRHAAKQEPTGALPDLKADPPNATGPMGLVAEAADGLISNHPDAVGAILVGAGILLGTTGVGAAEGLVLAETGGTILTGASIANSSAALAAITTGSILMSQNKAEETASPGDKPSSTPIGRRGNPIDVPSGTNEPAEIGGRVYTGHALDRMQGRGVTPSPVEEAIQNGKSKPGHLPGTTVHSGDDGVRVVTGPDGQVITVVTQSRR
jgi:hypothetical protein